MPKREVSQHVNANIESTIPRRAEMGSHSTSGMHAVGRIGAKGVKRLLTLPVVRLHT